MLVVRTGQFTAENFHLIRLTALSADPAAACPAALSSLSHTPAMNSSISALLHSIDEAQNSAGVEG